MSLDLYLRKPGERAANAADRIFIRRDGATVEITRDEWDEMYPDRAPAVSVAYENDWPSYVYEGNITHNLGKMAREAGLYEPLWRPDEIPGVKVARDLIPMLRDGLRSLSNDRGYFEQFNPENGWGDYDLLVRFTAGFLAACEEYPDAEIEASR